MAAKLKRIGDTDEAPDVATGDSIAANPTGPVDDSNFSTLNLGDLSFKGPGALSPTAPTVPPLNAGPLANIGSAPTPPSPPKLPEPIAAPQPAVPPQPDVPPVAPPPASTSGLSIDDLRKLAEDHRKGTSSRADELFAKIDPGIAASPEQRIAAFQAATQRAEMEYNPKILSSLANVQNMQQSLDIKRSHEKDQERVNESRIANFKASAEYKAMQAAKIPDEVAIKYGGLDVKQRNLALNEVVRRVQAEAAAGQANAAVVQQLTNYQDMLAKHPEYAGKADKMLDVAPLILQRVGESFGAAPAPVTAAGRQAGATIGNIVGNMGANAANMAAQAPNAGVQPPTSTPPPTANDLRAKWAVPTPLAMAASSLNSATTQGAPPANGPPLNPNPGAMPLGPAAGMPDTPAPEPTPQMGTGVRTFSFPAANPAATPQSSTAAQSGPQPIGEGLSSPPDETAAIKRISAERPELDPPTIRNFFHRAMKVLSKPKLRGSEAWDRAREIVYGAGK